MINWVKKSHLRREVNWVIKTFQKCLPKSKEQVIDKLYNSKIREIEGKKKC